MQVREEEKSHRSSNISSRLTSKTPSTFLSLTTSKDHDSHIGQIFHDVVFDEMIHEFDESQFSHHDHDQQQIIDSSLTTTITTTTTKTNNNNNNNNNINDQLQTINDFQCYLNFKRILCLLTLFSIGLYQFMYYKHYFLSFLFPLITFILYLLLFIKKINILISSYYYCSYFLLIVRIFHIISIFTLFFGVITCQYHFNIDNINNKILINYILFLERILYISLIIATLSCLLQNFYIIKYDKFIISRFKGIYCYYLEFHILKNGKWRNDIQPISSFDRLLTFILLLSSFSSIMISIICINRMELA